MAEWCRKETGEERLCMAGGVALNSVANGRVRDENIFSDIWVQPAASDAGCSLGIPFYIWNERLGHPRTYTMDHAYWGPEYPDSQMEQALHSATASPSDVLAMSRVKPPDSWRKVT